MPTSPDPCEEANHTAGLEYFPQWWVDDDEWLAASSTSLYDTRHKESDVTKHAAEQVIERHGHPENDHKKGNTKLDGLSHHAVGEHVHFAQCSTVGANAKYSWAKGNTTTQNLYIFTSGYIIGSTTVSCKIAAPTTTVFDCTPRGRAVGLVVAGHVSREHSSFQLYRWAMEPKHLLVREEDDTRESKRCTQNDPHRRPRMYVLAQILAITKPTKLLCMPRPHSSGNAF